MRAVIDSKDAGSGRLSCAVAPGETGLSVVPAELGGVARSYTGGILF